MQEICVITLSCNSAYCCARVNRLPSAGCELVMRHNLLYGPRVLTTQPLNVTCLYPPRINGDHQTGFDSGIGRIMCPVPKYSRVSLFKLCTLDNGSISLTLANWQWCNLDWFFCESPFICMLYRYCKITRGMKRSAQ
jgi:hypothetical protein